METSSSLGQEDQERRHISSQPEFAEIFIFLQVFGPLMNLSKINLKDLEDFFTNADCTATEVVNLHWHLVRCTGRNGGKEDWQRMAVKFAGKVGLLATPVPYQDITVLTRMKLFQLTAAKVGCLKILEAASVAPDRKVLDIAMWLEEALRDAKLSSGFKSWLPHERFDCAHRLCEEQFECNVKLRRNLSWDMPFFRHTKPIGVDRDGRRYWLLQDSVFDLHLYSDHGYADPPKPNSDTWRLLARSLSDLANHISFLESRPTQTAKSTDSATPTHTLGSPDPGLKVAAKSSGCSPTICNRQRRSQKRGKKMTSSTTSHKVIGCLKCLRDVDYKKMLLCDTCDRECHTYCHYPVLWTVPKGEWLCPMCKEQQLLKELQQVYLGMSRAKAQHEEFMERKQKKVARLQKSGVLTQNILNEEEKGRSRRQNRKQINYAELNDIHLPPLSPSELEGRKKRVTSVHASTRRSKYSYIQEDYLAPRVRTFGRRFRGLSPKLDAVVEEEVKLLEEEKGLERKEEENKWEEEMDERKCVTMASSTCSHSAVAVVEAAVKETSMLGKRSHDQLCHEDANDDHITISLHKALSASASYHKSVGCGFSEAVANGSSTLATRKPLQHLGSKGVKRNDVRCGTEEKSNKLTEVCTMEEDFCKLHPRHHSSSDALTGSHERAYSDGSTPPPASLSPEEEASPRENVEFKKPREGSLDCLWEHTK